MSLSSAWPGVIEAYRAFMPVVEGARIITLREDGTHERADFLLLRERRKALEGK